MAIPFDFSALYNGVDYYEATAREVWRAIHPDGVEPAALDELEVYADDTGLQVKVKAGACWAAGNRGRLNSEQVVPLAEPPHATLDRWDLVVARNTFSIGTGAEGDPVLQQGGIDLDILTGTPDDTPVFPTAADDSTKFELPLAAVFVAHGDTSLASGTVTDVRKFTSYERTIGFGRRTTPLALSGNSDITALTVTAKVRANRLVKITAKAEIGIANAPAVMVAKIKADGTTLDRAIDNIAADDTNASVRDKATFAWSAWHRGPTSGSHTYTLTVAQAETNVGGVTSQVSVQAGIECSLVVEDVGAWPVPA